MKDTSGVKAESSPGRWAETKILRRAFATESLCMDSRAKQVSSSHISLRS